MNINMNGSGKVVIDGREFNGRNVQISGNKVIVDGVTQDGELVGNINVTVHGDVESLSNGSGKVTARNVGNIKTGSGGVECGNVSGNITTGSGDVDCEDVGGNIRTGSGDVVRR
tara:strand:- start:48 stop:389 length:342 start_codon:yes stop_codon:yes gene_type:complete